jgi:hypothetical protein
MAEKGGSLALASAFCLIPRTLREPRDDHCDQKHHGKRDDVKLVTAKVSRRNEEEIDA